ncbi:MAG: hypothetical protein HYZ25_08985 [Chloroflexi bacterium]|nr:hypothetical protein [Chloroflexota bacterium]
MSAHRRKSTQVLSIFSVLALVTFACATVAGNAPGAVPTEAAPTADTPVPTQTQALLSPNSLPMPSGLVLESAVDTERTLSGYQVAYLEDLADGFSGENQSEVDMYFGETRQFTVQLTTGKQPLVWTTGWCAQGEETLKQNLEKIQFEMAVDGQPVDLEQVYKSDNEHSWHTAGNLCRFYRILVNDWPEGTTTLTSKAILQEPIHDGLKEYPAGELTRTYRVIRSGGASQGNPSSGGPTLGTPNETQAAIKDGVKSITSLAEGTPFSYNGTTRYDVKLNSSNGPLLWWSNGWCTTTDQILAQNLENIRFEMSMNEQPVSLDKAFPYFYKSSDGLSCFSYAIVMHGWTSDTTVLASKITMLASLNDGMDPYSAGTEYTKNIVINGP